MVHAVILAGGSGTRLWPLSRTHYPKQFLQLLGNDTLLQQTALRIGKAIPVNHIWVVTGIEQEYIVRTQLAALPDLDKGNTHVLVEPLPRNTAAAIGLAALCIRQMDPEGVMIVLPADHWIGRQEEFSAVVRQAVQLAQQSQLMTLGIVPDRPETGYGYIQRSVVLAHSETTDSMTAALPAYRVNKFVEKPDESTAHRYIASGDYYWNAGIFIWQASTILSEIAVHLPALSAGLETIAARLLDGGDGERGALLDKPAVRAAIAKVYAELESISIDYGVLEKAHDLLVLPADIGWSDVGDWSTLHRLLPQDVRGNTFGANVFDVDSENSFVHGNQRTIATIGLKNTVIIDTEDALLVCQGDRAQEVKTVVSHLQGKGLEVTHTARTVRRPWGAYTVLEEGPGFKVKRVTVNPGAALSLQLHSHRSEHWVVVSGTALVTNGEQEYRLLANQSTYIPRETRHRLSNPGIDALEIIEVQTGDYLGEDDIVRFADLYHRVAS